MKDTMVQLKSVVRKFVEPKSNKVWYFEKTQYRELIPLAKLVVYPRQKTK